MGNHEFCEDCGISSFHHGKPCDPERLAAMQAENADAIERKNKREQDIRERCARVGLNVDFTRHGAIVSIRRPA